jgi:CheY-like chemotaxis protein
MFSILVIDDEPDNFDVIETFLSDQDYQLHYASSGAGAIAALPVFQPDLILLDVMMPDMDGMAVCQRLKAMATGKLCPSSWSPP